MSSQAKQKTPNPNPNPNPCTPHAVCMPYPAQGHINPMLKLAKLLHHKGFHITFVNTEFNHRRLLKSQGPHSLSGTASFRFETIPDGLPPSEADATQDNPALCHSIMHNFIDPFRVLLDKLNDEAAAFSEVPPVTCVVSDGAMSCFTLKVAEEVGIPAVIFFPTSATGLMGHVAFPKLIEKGLAPLKVFGYGLLALFDSWRKKVGLEIVFGYSVPGPSPISLSHYCDVNTCPSMKFPIITLSTLYSPSLLLPFFFTRVHQQPHQLIIIFIGMAELSSSRAYLSRLRSCLLGSEIQDLESGIWSLRMTIDKAHEASAIIFNTFDALEHDVLEALSTMYPPIYPIGPLQFLLDQFPQNHLNSIGSSLWKEETECLSWLDSKKPNSVIYVNFGSITVMTPLQLIEFAWGLANSNQTFLWIIRPDLVVGDSAILPPDFVSETKERSLLASWCPQELVLNHPSVGGFLTHSGWNSTLESICSGVPMLCWPFFAEQQTNCWSCCSQWGVGMEINSDVKREEVERMVRELMGGERGKEMRRKVMEWKKLGEEATACSVGSAYLNFEKLVRGVLMSTGSKPK
ncbi:hypothetical protein ACSBR1_000823 [Camellia fascicularis]